MVLSCGDGAAAPNRGIRDEAGNRGREQENKAARPNGVLSPPGRRWPKKGSATEREGRRRCSEVAGGRRWSLAEKLKTEEGV